MTELQPLNNQLILDYLTGIDSDYSPADNGYSYEYEYDEESDSELEVWLGIEGGGTYLIQISELRKRFPRANGDRLVWLCNTWNTDQLYPCACLYPDENDPDSWEIVLEHAHYTLSGITQEQFNELTEEMVDGAYSFWQWVHEEHEL